MPKIFLLRHALNEQALTIQESGPVGQHAVKQVDQHQQQLAQQEVCVCVCMCVCVCVCVFLCVFLYEREKEGVREKKIDR